MLIFAKISAFGYTKDFILTYKLLYNGNVFIVGNNGEQQNEEMRQNKSEWTNIVAIAAGEWHTVGLRADGTVVTTRPNQAIINIDESFGLACKVQDWTDVAEIAAGCGLTVGLKTDGTVLVAGYNNVGQRYNISQIGKVPPRQY